MENIKEQINQLKTYFNEGKTLDLDKRIGALKAFKSTLIKKEKEIFEAVNKDLNKSPFEAYATEMLLVLEEIDMAIKKIKTWSKPKKVSGGLINFPSKGKIYPQPYGSVLIISPWNYPVQLALLPLVGAIASGNTVLIKPSELSPHTSEVIKDIVEEAFDKGHVNTILGDASVATEILKEKFDLIFFTGSTAVGKIIMQAAAEHLTPVILELGGKSPCIVDETANLELAAKRIVWGKFINSGQTCIAPDYLLVAASIKEPLVEKMKVWIKKFYFEDNVISREYGKIINEKHFNRLLAMLDNGQVICGGKSHQDKLIIEPTLMVDVPLDSQVMTEEIFGPLLPILTINNIDEAIGFINEKDKPLALYYFSEDKKRCEKLLKLTASGGGCINDTIMHVSTHTLPFGGVGASGMGAYHGKKSFEAFSHYRGVLFKSTKIDLNLKYPPSGDKLKLVKKLMRQ